MYGEIEEICRNKSEIWPAPRSGHRICASDNFIYLFGGYNPVQNNTLYNELWRYNITTHQWVLLPDREGLCPKECASSSMILWRNKIIIFGGSGYPFAYTNSNKFLMYCLHAYKWYDLNEIAKERVPNNIESSDYTSCTDTKDCGCNAIKYKMPVQKYGQSMALCHGNRLVIFSGTAGRWFTDELHIFDLRTFEWSQLDLCEEHNKHMPSSRYRHEVVMWKNEYLIFGGAILDQLFGFENVHAFDVKHLSWKKYELSSNLSISTRTEENKVCFPISRKAHTCVRYEDKVIMIGGIHEEEELHDIWVLDLSNMRWLYSNKLNFPYRVYFHSAAVTSNGCLYVYGGVVNSEGLRTSNLHLKWLKAPSLREQCWIKVSQLLKRNNMLQKNILLELGVPKTFMYRIDDTVPTAG